MRKKRKNLKLGSDKSHTDEMLRSLTIALVNNESIATTKPRSRAVKAMTEKLISIAKKDQNLAHKKIFSLIRNKKATKKIIDDLAGRFKDVTGGFVSIYKSDVRRSDSAVMYRTILSDYEYSNKKSTSSKNKK